jgi:O-antigen ligase
MTISSKSFNYLLFLSPLLVVIVFFNSLIFVREAMYFILFYFIVMFSVNNNKLPYMALNNMLWLYVLIFVAYICIRAEYTQYGITVILETSTIAMIFILSAFLAVKGSYYRNVIWYLTTVYFWMYLFRSSIEFEQLKHGYNLSTGMALFSLLPLIGIGADNAIKRRVFYVSILCSLLSLMYIGARVAFVSILMLGFIIVLWGTLGMQKRKRFITFSVILVISLIIFYPLYFMFATIDQVSWVGGDGQSSFHFLNKRIGTRIDIWTHLFYYISLEPLLGHGTHLSTNMLQPVDFIDFNMHRDNISAHSTYLEMIYRVGFFGLFLFLVIFFKIINILSRNLHIWEVKVVSAYVLSLFVFMSTSVFLVFDANLNSIFPWIALGAGIGVSLRKHRTYMVYHDTTNILIYNNDKQVNKGNVYA